MGVFKAAFTSLGLPEPPGSSDAVDVYNMLLSILASKIEEVELKLIVIEKLLQELQNGR